MKRIPVETQDKVVAMYTTKLDDGTWLGTKTIARTLGLNIATVQNIISRHGIISRSAKEAHSNGKRCKPIVNIPPDGEEAPVCKCGCGCAVAWNRRKNKWNVYTDGHYRKQHQYKEKNWLANEYETSHKTAKDIGDQFGVNQSVIFKFLRKFGIRIRKQSESLALSGKTRGSKNPAWRGGVAKWDYSFDWKSLARNVRERDSYTCQSCGLTKKRWGVGLHVHHIDQDKTNNNPENLISLCAQCHREVHAGKRVLSLSTAFHR